MSRRKNRKLEKLKKVKKKKQIIKIISVIIITGIVFCANNKAVKGKIALIKNQNFKFQENRNIIESEETKEVIAKQETIQPKVEATTNNEDSEIKAIVEKYIKDKNLNEENFAFVYSISSKKSLEEIRVPPCPIVITCSTPSEVTTVT